MSNDKLPRKINVKEIKEFSKDILPSLGCLMLKKSEGGGAREIGHAPYTLLPSPVPRRCFEEAVALQTPFQSLICKVAHDYHFLKECLQSVIGVDDFTGRLWNVYETVHNEGLINPLTLSMMRVDYMFHNKKSPTTNPPTTNPLTANPLTATKPTTTTTTATTNASTTATSKPPATTANATTIEELPTTYHHLPPDLTLKQIEMNTISASFAGLSQAIAPYYALAVRNYLHPGLCVKIPPNRASDGLAEGLIGGWKAYNSASAVIVFLVGSGERNLFDQRMLELSVIRSNNQVKVIRRTHKHFRKHSSLDDQRRLFVDGLEVAVLYFRTWYTPEECEGGWECRLMMERSKAIMVPSVAYQLAGTKKVQQVLGGKRVLERFVDDARMVEKMRAVFAGQYSLDQSKEGEVAMEMGLKDPNKFVIKPQREGGGNNFYNEEVRTLLKKLQHSKERAGFIMMDRIIPLEFQNVPVVLGHDDDDDEEDDEGEDRGASSSPKPSAFVSMVSELGIFGYLIGKGGSVVENRQSGHLLRTKRAGMDEGGVATGYSVMDTPFLVG